MFQLVNDMESDGRAITLIHGQLNLRFGEKRVELGFSKLFIGELHFSQIFSLQSSLFTVRIFANALLQAKGKLR